MTWRVILTCTALALLLPAVSQAQRNKRPKWDQKKAVEKVRKVLELECKGDLPWDKIKWMTDVNKAVALAKKANKPLFVYFFLKKNVGPATAPC